MWPMWNVPEATLCVHILHSLPKHHRDAWFVFLYPDLADLSKDIGGAGGMLQICPWGAVNKSIKQQLNVFVHQLHISPRVVGVSLRRQAGRKA